MRGRPRLYKTTVPLFVPTLSEEDCEEEAAIVDFAKCSKFESQIPSSNFPRTTNILALLIIGYPVTMGTAFYSVCHPLSRDVMLFSLSEVPVTNLAAQ